MSSFAGHPMPPDNPYAIVEPNFFRYIWDTTGVQEVTEIDPDTVLFVPQVGHLVVYGRLVRSRYPEDRVSEERLRAMGRVMGEWFSTACVEGELGSVPLAVCEQIDAKTFSAAYQRGWAHDPA